MTMETTCWTLIEGAGRGETGALDDFVHAYAPVIRAYLAERWRGSPLGAQTEDAVQEVFMECFKTGGVLARIADARVDSFGAFLNGVCRNVALRLERTRARRREIQPDTAFERERPADEERLSLVFDRSWARALLRRAIDRHAERASDDAARKRVTLLCLRFEEGLGLRAIAAQWGAEYEHVRHQNRLALREFEDALADVVAFHHPNDAGAAKREIERLHALLG